MSTLSYPHDRRELVIPTSPVHFARALRYLSEKFSLTEDDIRGHDGLLRLLSGLVDSHREADRLVLEDAVLFRKSVKNALKNLGLHSIEEEDLSQMTEMVRRNIGISFEGVETFLEGFHPLEAADEFMETATPLLREEAIEEVDARFGVVTDQWTESEYALSDEQMFKRFSARVTSDPKYLTTYFDSACMGLVDKELQSRVELVSRNASKNWPAFVKRMKSRITRSLEDIRPGENRRFLPENAFFQANGTEAFRRFRAVCMPQGSRVLATNEEYFELIKEMKENGVDVKQFSDLEELVHLLDASRVDFILASEVGRLGSVHPLNTYHEARVLLSPQTKLIVDACQSAGRWEHDMASCKADAVILSTQKGSDLGGGMGVVALADDFEYVGLSDQSGSLPHEAIARTAFAMNPDGLRTLTPTQRAEAIDQNAKKFVELLSMVNSQTGNRIKILSPSDTESKPMGHAIELNVEGVSRKDVCRLAEAYGVYIADSYVSPKSGESIRVAFHPYMNNDALRILAYVLLKACETDPGE